MFQRFGKDDVSRCSVASGSGHKEIKPILQPKSTFPFQLSGPTPLPNLKVESVLLGMTPTELD